MSLVFTDLYIDNKCCTIPLSYLKFKLLNGTEKTGTLLHYWFGRVKESVSLEKYAK